MKNRSPKTVPFVLCALPALLAGVLFAGFFRSFPLPLLEHLRAWAGCALVLLAAYTLGRATARLLPGGGEGAFIALGLFTSSLTSNQIAAAILAIIVLLFFWLVGALSYSVSQGLGDVLKHLSILENYQDFSKGIIDTKNIIYFLSLVFIGLFLSVRSLEHRRTI